MSRIDAAGMNLVMKGGLIRKEMKRLEPLFARALYDRGFSRFPQKILPIDIKEVFSFSTI